MTLTITGHGMTSDHTPHTARPAPGRQHAWQVSWLPGRLVDRNSAITAMTLADTATATAPATGPGLGRRRWPHIQGWAAELGRTAPDAITLASAQPGRPTGREAAPGPPDREAAGP